MYTSYNDPFEDDVDIDIYDQYFISNRQLQQQRRTRKEQRRATDPLVPTDISEQRIGEHTFVPSFTTADNELQMLQNALTTFYQEHVISDVLASVKGGKEASVYCCEAHPSTGYKYIAAKIYRPRMFRSLRNDAPYKEGRESLDENGKAIRDTRRHRAMLKKTVYGKEVSISSWIEHEFSTMKTLYDAGAAVPKPLMRGNNTILMEYLGELHRPAPTLNGVTLQARSAQRHFQHMLDNVGLMLANNRVHADFSSYNILYWEDELTIIDFPQAVHALSNRNAQVFLQRDIKRLCQYFQRYEIQANPQAIADTLWQRFMDAEL